MKTELFPVIKFFKKAESTNAFAGPYLENSTFQSNFVIVPGSRQVVRVVLNATGIHRSGVCILHLDFQENSSLQQLHFLQV